MKILYPIEFNHDNGGMVQSTLLLAVAIAQRHQVSVICPENASYLPFLRENDVSCIEVPGQEAWRLGKGLRGLKELWMGRSKVRERLPDCDVIHVNHLTAAVYLSIPTKLSRKPFVYTIRGDSPAGWRCYVYSKIFKKADSVVFTSESTKEVFSKLLPNSDSPVIPNTIVPPKEIVESRSFCRIAVVGHFNENKNQMLALEAFSEARKRNDGLTLLFFGSPTCEASRLYLNMLKSRVSELGLESVVLFPGFEKCKEIMYGQCDVVLSVSKSEGFGRSIAEGMAYGKLVIGMHGSGGLRDIIKNGERGLLLDKFTKQSVANALLSAVENPSWAASLARAGRLFSIAQYSPDVIADRYLKVYEGVL